MPSRTFTALITAGLLVAASGPGCVASKGAGARIDPSAARPQIEQVLDTLHAAAARADEATYFAQFAPNAVFLGTDPGERWSLEAFRAYAKPHFDNGRGWAYRPSDRTITVAADGDTAWFDEVVTSEKYGRCRGTGVLVYRDGGWRVAQYSLSLPIPNSMFQSVASAVKAGRFETPNP